MMDSASLAIGSTILALALQQTERLALAEMPARHDNPLARSISFRRAKWISVHQHHPATP
jgi:hypothetical protein